MTDRIKYPRTFHLPWSQGITKDDRVMTDTSELDTNEIVLTEKMDGENASLYRDGFHARSIDSGAHESRNHLWKIVNQIGHKIPKGYRVCGENLYAKHSIKYDDLEGYFLMFSIWDGLTCLSWNDTMMWAEELELPMVPVFGRGPITNTYRWPNREGYVIRVTRQFHMNEFHKCVGKYVRANHVTTDSHWMHKKIERNGLAE